MHIDLGQIQQALTIALLVAGILVTVAGYVKGRNLAAAWQEANALGKVRLAAEVIADAAQGVAAAVDQWAAMKRKAGEEVSSEEKHLEGISRLGPAVQQLQRDFPAPTGQTPLDLDTVLLAGVAAMKAGGLEVKATPAPSPPVRGANGQFAKRE